MDKQLAVLLGNICQYVYSFDPTQLSTIGDPGVTPIHDAKMIPTSYAGILRYPDKTVLAFQGTITNETIQAVKDWLQNFRAARIIRVLGLPGTVHLGFVNQLRLIWDDLLADLATDLKPPFYVTGHSQGGAIAALATKALELVGIRVDATYTFAAPRGGDGTFAQSVMTPVYRVEFGDDVVPHVPFVRPSLGGLQAQIEAKLIAAEPELQYLIETAAEGYEAIGPLTYGRSKDDLRISMTATEEASLRRDRILHQLIAGPNLFNHHHMPNYIGLLS